MPNVRRYRRDGDLGPAVHRAGPPASKPPSFRTQAIHGTSAAAEARRQLRRLAHHRVGDAGIGRGGERASRQLEQIRGPGLADQPTATGWFVPRRRSSYHRGNAGCCTARTGQYPSPRLRTGSVRQLAASFDYEQQ